MKYDQHNLLFPTSTIPFDSLRRRGKNNLPPINLHYNNSYKINVVITDIIIDCYNLYYDYRDLITSSGKALQSGTLPFEHILVNQKYHNLKSFFSTIQYLFLPAYTESKGYCVPKTRLKPVVKSFFCKNINSRQVCFEKDKNMYLKAENSPRTTRVSIFKYIFIVFFEKITMGGVIRPLRPFHPIINLCKERAKDRKMNE